MTNLDEIIDEATEVLGTRERALDWIEKRSATLGGAPVDLVLTDEGKEKVLLHLAGISRHHGIHD